MFYQFYGGGTRFAYNCRDEFSLQENFDRFMAGQRAAGLDPCMGEIGLWIVKQFSPESIAHLDVETYAADLDGNRQYWQLKPELMPASWPGGITYREQPLVNPQYPPRDTCPVTLAMIAEAIRAQTFDQAGADALIKLIQERMKTT